MAWLLGVWLATAWAGPLPADPDRVIATPVAASPRDAHEEALLALGRHSGERLIRCPWFYGEEVELPGPEPLDRAQVRERTLSMTVDADDGAVVLGAGEPIGLLAWHTSGDQRTCRALRPEERITVTVRVESPLGTAVPGTSVSAHGAKGRTGEDGRVELLVWAGVAATVHAEKPSDADPDTMIRGWDVDEVALLAPWTHDLEIVPSAGAEVLVPTLTRPQWSCGARGGPGPVRSCPPSAVARQQRRAQLEARLTHLASAAAEADISAEGRAWLQRWIEEARAELGALEGPHGR